MGAYRGLLFQMFTEIGGLCSTRFSYFHYCFSLKDSCSSFSVLSVLFNKTCFFYLKKKRKKTLNCLEEMTKVLGNLPFLHASWNNFTTYNLLFKIMSCGESHFLPQTKAI